MLMRLLPPTTSNTVDVEVLSRTRVYRDYQRAFTGATKLPLDLHPWPMVSGFCPSKDQANPFCWLLAKTVPGCAACLELQQQLTHAAERGPATLKCFAGLCESAAPVRVGNELVAFLRTGQVFLRRPTEHQFNRVAATLLQWGAQVDLKRLEEAYFHTRVLEREQYECLIRLLAIFAEHLAACAEQLPLRTNESEPRAVRNARAFVEENHTEELSLRRVAQVINLSASYFSELFKKSTGINFVEYVARVRIEKAKSVLRTGEPSITAIAFNVGFQSLSQFNRAFKKITGRSPREFRQQSAGA